MSLACKIFFALLEISDGTLLLPAISLKSFFVNVFMNLMAILGGVLGLLTSASFMAYVLIH
ncbi:MAG: hypothetical protein P8Y09_12430 [Deltaproteobacteria bacterium]